MKKALAILIGCAVAGMAPASSLFVNGFVAGQFRFVLTTFTGGTPSQNTQAGPMSALLDGSFAFNAYCVDSAHAPLIGTAYNTNLVTLPNAGLPNSGRIAYLYQQFSSSVTTQDMGVGLQLAIWDVLLDNGDGLSAGLFRASSGSGTMSQAASYITASSGNSASATWYQGLPPGPNQPQDLVGATPVPEPATIVGLGIAALALVRRRKQRA